MQTKLITQRWFENGERYDCGKMFPIDMNDKEIHQIFFDDNVFLNEYKKKKKLIVDVRDASKSALNSKLNLENGESIEPEVFLDKYVVKVNSLQAIMDEEYFIKKIQECEQRRSS